MRVTAEAKRATRVRILESAQNLFASKGFNRTTTRDLARAAGIATGTLFNYFPSKEAIVVALVEESLDDAQELVDRRTDSAPSLEEDLFRYAAAGLRQLRPYRGYIQPVLDTTLSPVVRNRSGDTAESLRVRHLETVQTVTARHRLGEPLSAIALQLYWTLYTGVLAFWAVDESPHQEGTLAVLDQSLRMFVRWLRSGADSVEPEISGKETDDRPGSL